MKIAITGQMRSGKDTFANYFMMRGFQKVAFGDGIKEISYKLFPEKMSEGKPRELYQSLGQKLREIDQNVWINLLDRRVKTMEAYGATNFIVTDLRQLNEYEFLKENGFTIVKIEADDELRKMRMEQAGDMYTPESFYHETEVTVNAIPYDYLVTNNNGYADLSEQARYIFLELRGEEV